MVGADHIAAAPELIPPSSPTPSHLRHLPLSFLDQLAPPIFIHIILYFHPSNPDHHQTTSESLKRSFADALSVHYPLAGRLRDNSRIDCNDAGAEYVEAWFLDHNIADVVKNSLPEDLKRYVPASPSADPNILLAVQISFFGCGGVAVGVCMSHRVADAKSMVAFVTAWAATCRKAASAAQPSFGLASHFPPVDFSRYFPPPPSSSADSTAAEKVVTKRFNFDKWKLSILKKATSGPSLANPTKVEAVSAFLWSHLIESAASKAGCGAQTMAFAATHAVDIRQRASPPLPQRFFGNACARAFAMTESPAGAAPGNNYYDLAVKLRDTISKADSGYVWRLEKGDDFLKYYSVNEENNPAFREGGKGLEMCGFTSWCRLPAYEADFGWGRPDWVSIVGVPIRNFVCFLGTKSGDGIEAWVSMAEDDIAVIERNYVILQKEVEKEVENGEC